MAKSDTRLAAVARTEDCSDSDLKRDQAYEQMLLDIICGDLRPGERIDETRLAERYAAGRAGIRDALYRLSLEGLVERRPRLGSIVVGVSVIELQQVFALRVQLEGQAAALAARNARDQDIAAIGQAFADADAIIDSRDWRRLVQADRVFHQAVAQAAQNRWLANVVAMLHNSALRFWHVALPRRPVEALRREITYHQEVAAAIAKRDPAAAQIAMRSVLGQFPATVQDLFRDTLAEAL